MIPNMTKLIAAGQDQLDYVENRLTYSATMSSETLEKVKSEREELKAALEWVKNVQEFS